MSNFVCGVLHNDVYVIVFEATECLLTETHTTLFCRHAKQNSSSHFCWNV